MEKRHIERRCRFLEAEGIRFRTGVNVGADLSAEQIRREHDATLLAGGAGWPRDLKVPGRELDGIHFAMEYLTQQNRRCEGDDVSADREITARDKHVVIIGGGDTGADCLGTVHRQGARSVSQFELLPRPPDVRSTGNPCRRGRRSSGSRPPTRRAGTASTPCRPSASRGPRRRVSTLHATKVHMTRRDGRPAFDPVPGSGFELQADLCCSPWGSSARSGRVC